MTRVLARCPDCGRVLTAKKADGEIRPIGTNRCPDCDGTNLLEVTNDTIETASE